MLMYTDFVANHNGFNTQSNSTFVAQRRLSGVRDVDADRAIRRFS